MNTEPQKNPVGPVTLVVRDLANCVAFYHNALGLRTRSETDGRAFLGAGGDDLLVLEENPAAKISTRTAGLYHVAILLPTRKALAAQLAHFAKASVALQGMADHSVSEAIYLADPEANGIEIYRDRPRDEWRWINGEIHMITEPLDVDDLMAEHEVEGTKWAGIDEGAVVGHVHLRVSNLRDAETFYREVLGFDVTTRAYPGASFLSRNGYHHHLGLNTWQSLGAAAAPENAGGLKHFEVRAASEEEFEGIVARARRAEAIETETDAGVILRDASGLHVLLTQR